MANSWKMIFRNIYVLLQCLQLASMMEIKVNGPDMGLTGDFEQFTCTLTGSDVSSQAELNWKYKLKSGEIIPVADTDKLVPLDMRNNTSGNVMVSSFIRLNGPNVAEVMCQHSSDNVAYKEVTVKDLKTVTAEQDPCEKSQNGKPVTVLQTSSMNFMPPYRMARYVDGEPIELTFPTEVSQLQLTCISDGEEPRWAFKKEDASKMKFAVWAQQEILNPNCKKQVIAIYEVAGKPGDIRTISFQCASGPSKSSPVDITFKIADIPMTRNIDFNRTEECVNEVVEQFYGKELTGVGVASSFVIVLMMVGMAIMKKQLNNQKNNNQGNQPSGNGNQQEPSTSGP